LFLATPLDFVFEQALEKLDMGQFFGDRLLVADVERRENPREAHTIQVPVPAISTRVQRFRVHVDIRRHERKRLGGEGRGGPHISGRAGRTSSPERPGSRSTVAAARDDRDGGRQARGDRVWVPRATKARTNRFVSKRERGL